MEFVRLLRLVARITTAFLHLAYLHRPTRRRRTYMASPASYVDDDDDDVSRLSRRRTRLNSFSQVSGARYRQRGSTGQLYRCRRSTAAYKGGTCSGADVSTCTGCRWSGVYDTHSLTQLLHDARRSLAHYLWLAAANPIDGSHSHARRLRRSRELVTAATAHVGSRSHCSHHRKLSSLV